MAAILSARVRPTSMEDYRVPSRPRTVGLLIATLGLALTTVAVITGMVAAGDESIRAATLPWSFGLTTLGFGTVKLAIGVILWGILMMLWHRVDAINDTLTSLVEVQPRDTVGEREVDTPFGRATVTDVAPGELLIHRMAKRMWKPMLGMGAMTVVVGFLVSLAWAANGSIAALSWTQGLQFLGEGLLLAGIAFLLGTILWAIRTGGGEIQEGLGVVVKTLRMPATAKVFVALMMLGLLVAIGQFVAYLVVAGGGVDAAVWLAFLGPLRELGLALILAGVTMALVTIANVLRFQFSRVVELIETGR